MFPFPSSAGKGSDILVAACERVPALDGAVRIWDGHVLALHLGRPLPIRQRREDVSFQGTYTRGDLSLIPAGWQTTCWTQETSDFLHIELGRELVNSAAAGAERAGARGPGASGAKPDDVDLPCLLSFQDPVCRELMLSMLAEAQVHGLASRMYMEAAAVVLVRRLLSLAHGRTAAAPRSGLPAGVLTRAKAFLHDEMSRNPGVAELSAAVGMNVHHFSRMFKRSTGLAPHQYLGNIRLERAKSMLADGRSPIIDIAFEIGYANPSQFSAFFRKRTGLSPSEFRRTVHNGR
jgi:AraC family transcriptional regulator